MQGMSIDPVCGMPVIPGQARSSDHAGTTFWFCSELCRREFQSAPARFIDAEPAANRDGLSRRVAYFSMEVALDPLVPTYSGGLGVLAGDTLRSFADLEVPVVAVSLLHRQGYFHQTLDRDGNQGESPVAWRPEELLERLMPIIELEIAGRKLKVGSWQYLVRGTNGYSVPVILLDTDLEENSHWDRSLSGWLYGGDEAYRFAQELLLGVGGVKMLRALGYLNLERFHLNEGHASLLVLELLQESHQGPDASWDFERVRRHCVFTTHTPVEAGHDRFNYGLVEKILGQFFPLDVLKMLAGEDVLNMTLLGLNMCHYVNGVAKRHGVVSRDMFPGYPIDSITNGVHSVTWTAESFRNLYDRHIPGWRSDAATLRHAAAIAKQEIWEAHQECKRILIERVNRETTAGMDVEMLTLGLARRATQYKRLDLVFHSRERLRQICGKFGSLQIVFAGKAHPRDFGGKDLIRSVFQAARELAPQVRIAYLADYDIELARLIVAGVDLWLNTPQKPLEASGTSGMKAAHNGVPSLSVLDGWWLEGHILGVTGWSIGSPSAQSEGNEREADDLYDKLENVILPMYHRDRDTWLSVMRGAIAFNASFFNTQRMVQQYALSAYLR